LELITTDSGISLLKIVWEKYAEMNGIDYDTLEDLVEKLPSDNIFSLFDAEELYTLIKTSVNFKKSTLNLLRSVVGDEIRSHGAKGNGNSRSIRKIWYNHKAWLQTVYSLAYKDGLYKFDLDNDPNFYDEFPKKFSEAIQYWTCNQIDKNTEWLGSKSNVIRAAVCDYEDIGLKDISRKRSHQERQIRLERMLEFFELFEDMKDYKDRMEASHNVMVNTYTDLSTIKSIIEEEIERNANYDNDNLFIIAMVEKDAEFHIVQPMGEFIGVSVISGKGQNSLASLESLKISLNMNEGAKIIFLSITDDDPKGLQIARSPAEQQFEKLGLDTIIWIHSMWQEKLDHSQRTMQAYLPKLSKRKNGEYPEFSQNWIDFVGYNKDTDVFGGGTFGFELECMSDEQMKESFAELCFATGLTVENMLNSFKDNYPVDVDDSVEDFALEYIKSNTEYDEIIRKLDELKDKICEPVDDIINELDNALYEVKNRIIEETTPTATEIAEKEDFDDRDISKHVDSFKNDFLAGQKYWSDKWSADICTSRTLNKKLKRELENETETGDFDISEVYDFEVDEDDLYEKIRDKIEEVEF